MHPPAASHGPRPYPQDRTRQGRNGTVTRLRLTLAQASSSPTLPGASWARSSGELSRGSRSLIATSELVRRETTLLIGQRILAYFDGAESLIRSVERQIQFGLCNPADPRSVEAALFAAALDDRV